MIKRAIPKDTQALLSIFREYFGDHLLSVNEANKNELHLLVETELFTDGVTFIFNNLLFDTTFITLLARDEREKDGQFTLHTVLLLKKQHVLVTLITALDGENPSYPAITPIIPAAVWHEWEIHDLFGITPKGTELKPLVLHRDWPRGKHYPMRKDFSKDTDIPIAEVAHQFDMPDASGVHQVAVGPIHAAIIEPGHMRFAVTGEHIHKFDAQLFYTYKGIEKMAEGQSIEEGLCLAEHVCGLCAFSHSLAYTQALENLGQINVPERALFLRAILLEMERLASHFADFTAICSAGGFGFSSARAGYFREMVLQINQDLTNHRFLRGINAIGGLKRNIPDENLQGVQQKIEKLEKQFQDWCDLTLHVDSFLDRVEEAGYLSQEQAKELGMVGPSTRGSGIDEDLRRDFPFGVHQIWQGAVRTYSEGDVHARMRVRIDEVTDSLTHIQTLIKTIPDGKISIKQLPHFPHEQAGIGLVESAKGGLVHWLILDEDNTISRWHVRSASYMNWKGMVQATMGNNIIPDGPLVNKSFNLCYACSDR